MHSRKVKKAKSCNGKWGRDYFAPVAGYKQGDKEFTTLDRLLIALQADGHLHGNSPSGAAQGRLDFMVAFKKERKIERFAGFLTELGIEYTTFPWGNGLTGMRGSLKDFLTLEEIQKIKTFEYINLEEVDSNWGKQFLEELKFWDSSTKPGLDYFTYYNSREEAINKVIEICAISGYRTCKGVNRTAEQGLKVVNPKGTNPVRKSAKTCWALCITPRDIATYPKRVEVDYDDFVYCVTVPSGCIIVRRNKSVVVSGNCRHSDAYARLIEVMGYNDEFKKLLEIPVFKKKLELFEKHFGPDIDFVDKLFFFVIVIENSSLFSQFANILAMSRFKGAMKNIANMIAWSSIDEQGHSNAGIFILNQIFLEHPEMKKSQEAVEEIIKDYIAYESSLLDWIFEEGEFEWYTKEDVVNFMKFRVDTALEQMGYNKIYNITTEQYSKMKWFDEEVFSGESDDFFAKRPTAYTKHDKPFDAESLF